MMPKKGKGGGRKKGGKRKGGKRKRKGKKGISASKKGATG